MSCLFHRILTFKEAFPFRQIFISDLDKKDMTNVYLYSWSTDGACWTNWVTYQQYLMLAKNIESDFYLRILIMGSIGEVKVDGALTNCYSICIEPMDFNTCFCDDPNLFQPYQGLDCALLLQQQISDTIVCMFGIPCYYFRCDPVEASADFTFKEFVMHNVVACKQIKLMIEDGEMPSSNPKLNELDFEWETDWETEISKTQFAQAFGDKSIPKAKDFIYIPLMKRMWEVNAAYDEKKYGLMWRSTTWKLALVKYEESTNIISDGFDKVIDNFVGKTYEKTFGKVEHEEQRRETGYDQVQAPRFAANNLYNIFMEDATRKEYTKNDVEIIDKMYCHTNTIVARNIYKFKNPNGCVTYQKQFCGDSGTILMMVETGGSLNGNLTKDIAEFGPIVFEAKFDVKKNEFKIAVEELESKLKPFTTYIIAYRWNRKTHTKELNIYEHKHDTDRPVYLLKPESYWYDFENPVCELVGSYNEDYNVKDGQNCLIHGFPMQMSNVKYYRDYLSKEDMILEALKYTTQSETCIINDLARPIHSGRGYIVK